MLKTFLLVAMLLPDARGEFALGDLAVGTLQGTVRAEGSLEPIPGATVSIAALGREAGTDPHGYFVLKGVPEGRWTVEARAIGYESLELTIVISGAGTIRLDFELPLRPVELPGLEVRTRAGEGTNAVPPPSLAGPAASRVQGARLRIVPGVAEADVLRGLQTLPSVAAISDYSSALYVRGGSGDQNLITLDGIPLFNPYHLGGIFSAIGMDAVSTVEVWPGAIPAAQPGDRLSSTVAIHTRSGGQDRVRASGAIGLISTHLTVDGPLPGGRGSYLFTGRRTYVDAITDAAYALKLTSYTMPYGFSDAYLKATHQVGELGSVAVSAYLNREGIHLPERMRQKMDGDIDFGWGSKMFALSYRQPFAGSFLLNTRIGYTDFSGTFDAWDLYRTGPDHCSPYEACYHDDPGVDTTHTLYGRTSTRDLLAGADLTWYGSAHTLRAGVQLDAYRFDHHFRNFNNVYSNLFFNFDEGARRRTVAAYLEDEWRATDRLSMRAGLRYLAAGPNGDAWLPRLGARLRLSPTLSLSLGAGRYAQVLRSMRDEESLIASLIAYDIPTAQPASVPLATGEDLVLGGEWVGERLSVQVDAYTRRIDGLVLGEPSLEPEDIPPLLVDEFRIGRGTARGLEVQLGYRRERTEYGLSYALTSVGREVEGERFRPRFERRHRVDATAVRRLGARGLLSGRLVVGSGQPYTPILGYNVLRVFDPIEGRWRWYHGGAVLGRYNSGRLPGYLRLDAAARKSYEKNWFGRDITLSPYLQILNVLNTKNVLIADSWSHSDAVPQFPILPTFGVEWKF